MSVRGGGRPKDGYYLANGDRVPSVTTVLSRFKDAGGLIYVAKKNWHEAGRRGLPFERDGYWGKPNLWGIDALQVGSVVHDWIEDALHGEPQRAVELDDAALKKAGTGFDAFQDWARLMQLEVLETETPLVSEEHRFGGTLDCLARIGGKIAIADWKSSNSVHRDYVAQLAAYRQLLRERDGEDAPNHAYLLRIGKEFGDFNFYSWPAVVLDLGWRWFLIARELYEADADLKAVAA